MDGLVDIYTTDLTKWLNDNINNVYYLEDAIKNGAEDGFNALQVAQYQAIDEVAGHVITFLLNEWQEEEEEEAEEVEEVKK